MSIHLHCDICRITACNKNTKPCTSICSYKLSSHILNQQEEKVNKSSKLKKPCWHFINEFDKVAKLICNYKINMQTSVSFLHTNNKLLQIELKEKIWFTIALRRIKYLGINLPKEVKSRLWFSHWSCMDVRVRLWRKLSTEKLMLLNCGC